MLCKVLQYPSLIFVECVTGLGSKMVDHFLFQSVKPELPRKKSFKQCCFHGRKLTTQFGLNCCICWVITKYFSRTSKERRSSRRLTLNWSIYVLAFLTI